VNRRLKLLLIGLLVALVPLRAMAAVLMPCCSTAEATHAVEAGADSTPCHEPEASTENETGCAFCAVHCAGAAQVLIQDGSLLPGAGVTDPIDFVARFLPGIIPGHLDRPPLAS